MRKRRQKRADSSVGQLRAELQLRRRRTSDLEDLRDLNTAIDRNAGKPGIPWEQVKKEIGL